MKNKRMYRSYRSIEKKRINYFAILIIILFIIGGIFIKLGFDYKEEILPIYYYNIEKTNNYEVVLKPNTFYETQVLGMDGCYASKSINNYRINFNYNFEANKNADLEYNYNVTATLVGKVKTNDNKTKEVWNRNFILAENNNQIRNDSNQFDIKEQVEIDYQYYNDFARSYEQEYGIMIEAVLKVRLNISSSINLYNLNIDKEIIEDYIELDIPITSTITEVNENYESVSSKSIMPEAQNIYKNQIIFYVIGSLFVIVAIAVIVIEIIKNKSKVEEMYEKNITRILKYYRDIIVTVTNEPDLKALKVMRLEILDDLIDVAEQNQSNIIRYEVIENEQSNLYVIVDKYVYMYVVTGEKLK